MNINEADSNYQLFYGFNDPEGQNIALAATSMIKPIPNEKELFLFDKTSRTTGYGGLVSARQLHFICGPYPELIIDENIIFDKIIQTIILPILLIMLISFNSLSVAVLTRPTMKTPVFTVLLGITIMEMFNGLLPLPMYLLRAFYGDPVWWEYKKYTLYNLTQISKWWKYGPLEIYQTSSNPIISGIFAWTTVFLPTVCHTTATWLTLFVALQRLIYIIYPNKATRLFSILTVRLVCVSVLLCALVLHIPMFQSTFVKFQPLLLHQNVILRNYSIDFKQISLYEALDYLPYVVMKCHTCLPIHMFLYFLTRVILIHLLPCILLIILTIIIIMKMRQINKKHLWLTRGKLLLQYSKTLPTYKQTKSYSLPITYKHSLSPELTNTLKQDFITVDKHHHRIQNKLNCFTCLITNKTNRLFNDEQDFDDLRFKLLNKNSTLAILLNGNVNEHIQESNIQSTPLRRKSQITEFFNVSNMLIVILIKFILIHLPNALVIFIYTLTLMQNRIYDFIGNNIDITSRSINNIRETIPTLRSTNQSILLPYTVIEFVNQLNSANTIIYINETPIKLLWIKVVIICNLLILCSYLLNFLIFWTMSTSFRTQFVNLFKCKCMRNS
ncbi:unnamed protein product [Schistosoma rodhaini]|uniref:G-protein coupled receptors family 1 profile domain-containing protein n=2 Tax=Schistosoma rodhaini TaxID=6188 RepID=A0AA85EV01_9TREM|nr:unnamed protein product [Schistosoma rodhaini]